MIVGVVAGAVAGALEGAEARVAIASLLQVRSSESCR